MAMHSMTVNAVALVSACLVTSSPLVAGGPDPCRGAEDVEARIARHLEQASRLRERDRLRQEQTDARHRERRMQSERETALRGLLTGGNAGAGGELAARAGLGDVALDLGELDAVSFGMLADEEESSGDLAKQLQNPLAALISVPFQLNWDTGIGEKDADRLLLNVQPVIPISLNDEWNLISRTIIPVVYAESPAHGVSSEFGLGDITQSIFFSPKEPVNGWIVGFGPVLQIPTGTDDLFRSKQFSLGPTAVFLRQDKGWTSGLLVNHLWRVAGSDDFADVNATFLQPFLSYTWEGGTSVGVNTESVYNWTGRQWTVPLNAFVSQVMDWGTQPVNLQLGARYYAEAPDGGPEWGLRFAVTFLFPK